MSDTSKFQMWLAFSSGAVLAGYTFPRPESNQRADVSTADFMGTDTIGAIVDNLGIDVSRGRRIRHT